MISMWLGAEAIEHPYVNLSATEDTIDGFFSSNTSDIF